MYLGGSSGRHSTYDDEIAERVCEMIALGYTLPEICGYGGIPSRAAVYGWLRAPENEAFRAAYRLAVEQREEMFLDEALYIARHPQMGTKREKVVGAAGVVRKETEMDMVEHRRLLCDVLFKHAAKMMPKKYGVPVRPIQYEINIAMIEPKEAPESQVERPAITSECPSRRRKALCRVR